MRIILVRNRMRAARLIDSFVLGCCALAEGCRTAGSEWWWLSVSTTCQRGGGVIDRWQVVTDL